MKISVLTATYNRANTLKNLYKSLTQNIRDDIEIEWLIMDDGSTDDTKVVIDMLISQEQIHIKYFYQENKGKMIALNNLVEYADSDFLIECDSDDYFTENAFEIVKDNCVIKDEVYAYLFLKYDQNKCNIGNSFEKDNYTTKMFDLYYKESITGDKALVYVTNIRKKYKYKLEKKENFSTEARLHHELDKVYNVVCFNKILMICDYKEDGYSKNIDRIFLSNPHGYFEYFKEMFTMDMKHILFHKRMYIIKHYILFSYLTNQKGMLKHVKGFLNKLLTMFLIIPGYIKTYIKFGRRIDKEDISETGAQKAIQEANDIVEKMSDKEAEESKDEE